VNTPLLFDLGVAPAVAGGLARGLGAEPGRLEHRQFPDGEHYLRVSSDCHHRTVVVACPLDRPDRHVLKLLLTCATLRDLGVARLGLVAPYLAYMRQDTRFRDGEGVTARYFAALLSRYVDWLVTVDPHLHRIPRLTDVYSVPATAVHAAPLMGDWIGANVSHPVLIGPDVESRQWVSAVAERAGVPYLVLAKERLGDRQVRLSLPDLARHRGRRPVLVDDMISTGHTLMEAVRQLADAGLAAPVCAAVHGLFAEHAWQGLVRAGAAEVVTCNTVVHSSNRVDVTPLLLDAVRHHLAAN
jgi:ribose-phosphate pyrophosphokinase